MCFVVDSLVESKHSISCLRFIICAAAVVVIVDDSSVDLLLSLFALLLLLCSSINLVAFSIMSTLASLVFYSSPSINLAHILFIRFFKMHAFRNMKTFPGV
jgi:hypothetical protein